MRNMKLDAKGQGGGVTSGEPNYIRNYHLSSWGPLQRG